MSYAPQHLKTFDSIVGPFDWSLPHDEGCPGCEIERYREALEAIATPYPLDTDSSPDEIAEHWRVTAMHQRTTAREALAVGMEEGL